MPLVHSIRLLGGPLDGGLIVNVGEPTAWLEVDCHTHRDLNGVPYVGLIDPQRREVMATLYYQRLDGAQAPPPGEHYRYQFRKRDDRRMTVEA